MWTVMIAGVALGIGHVAVAQQGPPIQGVTGTVAVEGTVTKEYDAAHTVVVAAVDGTEHVFHFAKGLLIHGSGKSGEEALRGLHTGTSVVVHYTVSGSDKTAHELDVVGGQGLKVTEGIVTRVDRSRKQITIRFDSGTTETLSLTDRAAADVGKDVDAAAGTTRIAVYYTDASGQRVVHFFRKKS